VSLKLAKFIDDELIGFMVKIGAFSLSSKEIAILCLSFLVLVAIFFFAPLDFGGDWFVIQEAAKRLLKGEELYQFVQHLNMPHGYYNPPWVAFLVSPIAFFPFRLSASIANAISIFGVLALSQRFKLSLPLTILMLVSPPVVFILVQGQVDIILMLLIFLPREWWAVVSITKPQIVGGLAFGLLRRYSLWIKGSIITVIVFGISFLFYTPSYCDRFIGFWA
jgi:hypothetical protein